MLHGKHDAEADRIFLFSKYQLMVSSILMATLPHCFPGMYVRNTHTSLISSFKKCVFCSSCRCVSMLCVLVKLTCCAMEPWSILMTYAILW